MTNAMIAAGVAVLLRENGQWLEQDQAEDLVMDIYRAMSSADVGEAEHDPNPKPNPIPPADRR